MSATYEQLQACESVHLCCIATYAAMLCEEMDGERDELRLDVRRGFLRAELRRLEETRGAMREVLGLDLRSEVRP